MEKRDAKVGAVIKPIPTLSGNGILLVFYPHRLTQSKIIIYYS